MRTQQPVVHAVYPLVCVCVVHCALSRGPCGEHPTRASVHCGGQVAEVRWVCYPSRTKTNIHTGPHKYWLLIQSSTYQGQTLNSTLSEAQGWIDPSTLTWTWCMCLTYCLLNMSITQCCLKTASHQIFMESFAYTRLFDLEFRTTA